MKKIEKAKFYAGKTGNNNKGKFRGYQKLKELFISLRRSEIKKLLLSISRAPTIGSSPGFLDAGIIAGGGGKQTLHKQLHEKITFIWKEGIARNRRD